MNSLSGKVYAVSKALIAKPVQSAGIAARAVLAMQAAQAAPTLLGHNRSVLDSGLKLTHIAAFTGGNAGDILLPVVLRDLFDAANERNSWKLQHAHSLVDERSVAELNRTRGIIIGGGGLFLRDTHANTNSGWQWDCPISSLEKISSPIVLFAVGYNRFRGQPDFDPVFSEHLAALAGKAEYIGLRNQGSLTAIRSYLPEALHGKLRYQPCMTTVLAKIYPNLVSKDSLLAARPRIAFNAAFDRASLRFGSDEVAVLSRLCNALKSAGKQAEIEMVIHCNEDAHISPFLRSAGIAFKAVNLVNASPDAVMKYYAGVNLSLGMRGHSQMIPFGCGVPILSLISHDKMRWFLDDIKRPEWGIEVCSPDIGEILEAAVTGALANQKELRKDILAIQDTLFNTSMVNVSDALEAFRR